MSFTHTAILARRTDYEWTFVIEKSKNLLTTASAKDISASLSIEFQLVDAATKDELTRYGATISETIEIGATAIGE